MQHALSDRSLWHSRAVRLLLLFLVGSAQAQRGNAAEYSHAYVYNGGNYTSQVWWDDSTTHIEGVIVHLNYATGAALYANANWRHFARSRNFAMMLTINQDNLLSAGAGVTIADNTLASVAAQSGHAELSAWQPYIFCGLSRGGGGAYGAIAQGWAAGRNKTIACVAYHGNSLVGNLYANTTDSKNIPVLYLIASLDYTRQADIEDWVRQGAIYGYSLRLNSALWTTSMQYGASHTSTGDDTYPLQWLGRCIDARLDNNNRGSLKPIVLTNCHGVNYTMASPNTTVCALTNISVTNFVQASKMIWLPPAGDSEWLWENATPRINSIPGSTNQATLGATNSISASASTPNGVPVAYRWSLHSGPPGGTATFGNSNTASTAVVFNNAAGLYVIRLLVTSEPGITNSAPVAYQVAVPNVRPVISSIQATAAGVFLTATNGVPGAGCLLLGSTNLAPPAWRILSTNPFNVDGTLHVTNPFDADVPQGFYRLQCP